MVKNTNQNDKRGVWNLWVNKIQFGWYIPCCHKCACWSHPILTFLTFHEIDLLPTCLQCYLQEMFLENDFICWCHFITDMIVYIYDEFGRNCWKTNEILHIVQSVALGVCFSIVPLSNSKCRTVELCSKTSYNIIELYQVIIRYAFICASFYKLLE